MENQFSMKELYDVFLKTTYPIEVGDKKLVTGETLCVFDSIQIANFQEIKKYVTAHGGYQDADRIVWEQTKGVNLSFTQGIFNSLQFGLLCNARVVYQKNDIIEVSKREEAESDENGKIRFSNTPNNGFFVYNKKSGEKIEEYEKIDINTIQIKEPYMDIILDYKYNYDNGAQQVTIGKKMIEGFLSLEAKTRVKDDNSGAVRTGILRIPKLKLMSDLSMRLGKNANPVVGSLSAVALPSGERGNTTVMDIFFLNDDIDTDM